MNKHTTRRLSLLLVLCLLLGLCLAGCGGNEPDGSSNPVTSTPTDDGIFDLGDDVFGDATTTSATATGGETTSDTASGGETTSDTASVTGNKTTSGKVTTTKKPSTVTTVYNSNELDPIAKKMPNIDLGGNKTVKILSHTTFETIPLMVYKYGITVENITVDQKALMSRFVTMCNADEAPDIYWQNYYPNLAAKGYVQAWDNYVDLNADVWKNIKTSVDKWAIGKKHYYLFTEGTRLGFVMYNCKAFKGLTEPAELFKQGKWNWDAMSDLAEKLTVDSNRDGKPEQYGLAIEDGARSFMYTTGSDVIDFVNGKPVNKFRTSQMARAVNYMVDLHNDVQIYGGGDKMEAFKRGEVAMYAGHLWQVLTIIDKVESGDVMFTAFPSDPTLDKYYMAEETPGLFLPAKAKNPKGAAAYMICKAFESWDKDYAAYDEKKEVALGERHPAVYYEMMDLIQKKTIPVQVGWCFVDINDQINGITRVLNGESWSKVCNDLAPQVDAACKTFISNTEF